MNKTVTINISGIIFHIDEDAFDNLSGYLAGIKAYVGSTDGGAEMLADIESRIAELLQQRLGTSRQVVGMADVEHVRSIMGRPEDFGGGEKAESQAEPSGERVRRRLFRNPDEKVLGGVCSGLGAYFDIDTVWVRLIMFLLVFFGGLSIWVYIILWIVIPQAKTTAEKLAMRGENANLNNIMRNFRDEAQDVKGRINKYGTDLNRAYGERVRSNLSSALETTFSIIGRIIGLILLLIGTSLLVGYVGTLTGISIVENNHAYSSWRNAIFASGSDYLLAVIAFVLVLGVPVFMLLYVGVKLLFRIRYSNRWLTLGLGLLWLFGVIIGLYVTVDTVREFSESSRVRNTTVLEGVGDTIVVKMRPAPEVLREWNYDNSGDLEESFEESRSGYEFGMHGKKLSVIGHARLDVIESQKDSVELSVNFISQGRDKRTANENARAIEYNYTVKGGELVFDEAFRVAEDGRWRKQRMEIKLRVPEGKVVFFDESVKRLLDDVDNTTNTWDQDMVNRRWKMTSRGLECIDCDDLKSIYDHHDPHGFVIDKEGIRIDDKEARIRINKKGIHVHTRGENEVNDEEPRDPGAPAAPEKPRRKRSGETEEGY